MHFFAILPIFLGLDDGTPGSKPLPNIHSLVVPTKPSQYNGREIQGERTRGKEPDVG